MFVVTIKGGFDVPGHEDTIVAFNLQGWPQCFSIVNATLDNDVEEAWAVTSTFYVSSLASTRACFAIVYILVRFLAAFWRPGECSSLRVG